MKQLILICFLCVAWNTSYAGTLQKKSSSFFGDKVTNNNNFNMGSNSADTSKVSQDYAGPTESVWNLDLYGFDFNLPDQPANEQFIQAVTGFGVTYKFNEHMHIWGRYSFFTVTGVKLDDVDTDWEHVHYVGGAGIRFNINERNRLTANLGVSNSKVKETKEYGEIEELTTGIVLDTKYLWTANNMAYGVMLSMVQVGSKSEELESHHKGGYVSVGAVFQFGLPEDLFQ
jgi:hypothetical protein